MQKMVLLYIKLLIQIPVRKMRYLLSIDLIIPLHMKIMYTCYLARVKFTDQTFMHICSLTKTIIDHPSSAGINPFGEDFSFQI